MAITNVENKVGTPELQAARQSIAARTSASPNGQRPHPFVEHPAAPLSDADRDIFLAMLDEDGQPNEALREGAVWFKQQQL